MTCDHCGERHDALGECLCPRCARLLRAARAAEDECSAGFTPENQEAMRRAYAAFRAVNIYREQR
jgi:hypothetical protein